MKTSFVKGALLFVGGALCAAVIFGKTPGMGPPGDKTPMTGVPMTPELFEDRTQHALVELADLGRYVSVFITEQPVDACVTPPRPTVFPPPGVNPKFVAAGWGAAEAVNNGYLKGLRGLVILEGKCRPNNP